MVQGEASSVGRAISDEDEGEKRQDKEPPAPRRSLRLLGVKRKNYIEHTLEPKNYAGDNDWESYMSRGSWGAAGRDYDDDWPGWAEEEKREDDDPPEVTAIRGRRTMTSLRTTAPTAAAITSGAVSSAAMKSRISAPPSIGVTINSRQWIEG